MKVRSSEIKDAIQFDGTKECFFKLRDIFKINHYLIPKIFDPKQFEFKEPTYDPLIHKHHRMKVGDWLVYSTVIHKPARIEWRSIEWQILNDKQFKEQFIEEKEND